MTNTPISLLRLRCSLLAIGIACAAAACRAAAAEPSPGAYPVKPVHMVVGFPPGGGVDLMARLIGSQLQDIWGQPVIIDNKPGADGIIATQFAARAAPDGHTLLIGATGHMTAIPALRRSLPYDTLRDFSPVAMIGSFPLVLAVSPAVPANTVTDLVALARKTPGKLNYAAGASAFQLAAELFKLQAGIDVRYIPYKGGAQAINAVLAGDVQMTFVDSAPVIPNVRAGRLRALAVTSPERAPTLPAVPTMIESGFRDYDVTLWTGLFAPARTPAPITERLQRDLATVLKSPQTTERFAALGIRPGGPSAAAFTELIRSEEARWSMVVKAAHLSAE